MERATAADLLVLEKRGKRSSGEITPCEWETEGKNILLLLGVKVGCSLRLLDLDESGIQRGR